MYEYDDDEVQEAMYENGRWVWCDLTKGLVYEKDEATEEDEFAVPIPTVFGAMEFRDDLDLIEQQRFRKRFQRKIEGEEDVVYLQDVKDVVLYTTPTSILTPNVINILHLSTTDRFLRALIFYCQYYLQTAEQMSGRVLEMETKIRTAKSEEIEMELKDNIQDLRLLVAKEYITMIIGGADFKKYHHMGVNKKSASLSKKDALMFESVLRIAIQIVWLSLGRKSFNLIELEVNRIFKSQMFNAIEHKLKMNYVANMVSHERDVLIGDCIKYDGKLNTKSPLMNDMLCNRAVDFRMLQLGVVKLPQLTPRLRYMDRILTMRETKFPQCGISLGIIGLMRSRFDIMLREIKIAVTTASTSSSFGARSLAKVSRSSMRKSRMDIKLYSDIALPEKKYEKEWFPEDFPQHSPMIPKTDSKQRRKWLARASQLKIRSQRRLHSKTD